jgi:hypothetical protein
MARSVEHSNLKRNGATVSILAVGLPAEVLRRGRARRPLDSSTASRSALPGAA